MSYEKSITDALELATDIANGTARGLVFRFHIPQRRIKLRENIVVGRMVDVAAEARRFGHRFRAIGDLAAAAGEIEVSPFFLEPLAVFQRDFDRDAVAGEMAAFDEIALAANSRPR